jgi:hypothetical protein
MLLDRYELVDIALTGVGVGSVGTRCYVLLLQGRDSNDPLFLQAKEAGPSVLEEFLQPSVYRNHGHRVVAGQRTIQSQSDIRPGWTVGRSAGTPTSANCATECVVRRRQGHPEQPAQLGPPLRAHLGPGACPHRRPRGLCLLGIRHPVRLRDRHLRRALRRADPCRLCTVPDGHRGGPARGGARTVPVSHRIPPTGSPAAGRCAIMGCRAANTRAPRSQP